MEDRHDDFNWGPIGRERWQAIGARVNANPKQVRFAAGLARGLSRTAAMRQAGFTNAATICQNAYRASRTKKVRLLLELAKASAPGAWR